MSRSKNHTHPSDTKLNSLVKNHLKTKLRSITKQIINNNLNEEDLNEKLFPNNKNAASDFFYYD